MSRRMSVLDHAVVLGFTALLAATLLSPVVCAPAKKTSQADPWWYHPCTGSPEKLRHSRSANHFLQEVYFQLKTFIGRLGTNIEHIQSIYKPLKPTTPTLKAPWLKIERMLKELKATKRHKKNSPQLSSNGVPNQQILDGMKKLYEHLQFFAGALDVIGKVDVETETVSFNGAKRKEIYKNNTNQLKSLLCEVFSALENNNEVPEFVPLNKMKIPSWKKLDLTRAYNLDLTFHTKMRKFFNRAQKIMRTNRRSRKNKSGRRPKSNSVHKKSRRT